MPLLHRGGSRLGLGECGLRRRTATREVTAELVRRCGELRAVRVAATVPIREAVAVAEVSLGSLRRLEQARNRPTFSVFARLGAELWWPRRTELAEPLDGATVCRLLTMSPDILSAVESGPPVKSGARDQRWFTRGVHGSAHTLIASLDPARYPPRGRPRRPAGQSLEATCRCLLTGYLFPLSVCDHRHCETFQCELEVPDEATILPATSTSRASTGLACGVRRDCLSGGGPSSRGDGERCCGRRR